MSGITYETSAAGAVDDFFALEAGGWKGRATAARDHEDVRSSADRRHRSGGRGKRGSAACRHQSGCRDHRQQRRDRLVLKIVTTSGLSASLPGPASLDATQELLDDKGSPADPRRREPSDDRSCLARAAIRRTGRSGSPEGGATSRSPAHSKPPAAPRSAAGSCAAWRR
jgi:hypothetical protein